MRGGGVLMWRRDEGFTVAELASAALLGVVVLTLATTLLVGASRTGAFTQGQGITINDARNAMQGIDRELRGADYIGFCTPLGGCLEVVAQTPSGDFETLRYTHAESELRREVFDDATGVWGDPRTIIERVVNDTGRPVFDCEKTSSYLRVTVDLEIRPSPRSDPNLNVTTTVRPRNFLSSANCPGGSS